MEKVYYHLVWITKYRKRILIGEVAERMKGIFQEIASERDIIIKGAEVMPDHVHLFVSAPPQYSPSLLINWFKGISARQYNFRFKKPLIKWTGAYYVGSAGTVTAETIRRYIEEQKS